jgi:hypothetical protein
MTKAITNEDCSTFIVREGGCDVHQEVLVVSESLEWDLRVENGFDIEFSVVVRSRLNASRGTWVIHEAERISKKSGSVNSSELISNGIKPPFEIHFRLSNEYSWFNPKNVHLNISRIKDVKDDTEPRPPITDQRLQSRQMAEYKATVSSGAITRNTRSRMDLLWLNHVIGEALMRCPDAVPDIRQKLVEIKALLVPHIKAPTDHPAVI